VVRGLGQTGVHPVLSPDARWIYFADKSAGILRMPAQGGAPEKILHMRGISRGISPDGRSIYFVRDVAGTTLWKLDLETREAAPALDGLVPYCTSCWALSATGIYYLRGQSGKEGRQAVFFHDVATRADEMIAEYPEPLLPMGSGPFSLSPDGKRLLLVRVDPYQSDIMRVDGFR